MALTDEQQNEIYCEYGSRIAWELNHALWYNHMGEAAKELAALNDVKELARECALKAGDVESDGPSILLSLACMQMVESKKREIEYLQQLLAVSLTDDEPKD